MKRYTSPLSFIYLLSLLVLAACGGGESIPTQKDVTPPTTTTPVPASTTIAGTVAAGAAVVGQVLVKDAVGNTLSTVIAVDGTYSLDITGMEGPYRLRAEGTIGGRRVRLHAYAGQADLTGRVNITPFSDLIVSNAAQQNAETFFDAPTTTGIEANALTVQEAVLQNRLQALLDALGIPRSIDLLHTPFQADHTGLDAVLDALSFNADKATNVTTITSLVDNTTLYDNVLDPTDNNDVLTLTDPGLLNTRISDIQKIVAITDHLTQSFSTGLPALATIQDDFSASFLAQDMSRIPFLTNLTTDRSLVGLTFNAASVSRLDSSLGTALVTFHFGRNGVVQPLPVSWEATRDPVMGWQLNGTQRIADMFFKFLCKDSNGGTNPRTGNCGIRTQIIDNDPANNGTPLNTSIASGMISILDGANHSSVKASILLGTPPAGRAGHLEVYDEGRATFNGDWRPFGTGSGQIDPAIFKAGDIIEYKLYTLGLDVSNRSSPRIAAGATAVQAYSDTLLFTPSTSGSYPTATLGTQSTISGFTQGNDLSVAWTPTAGTLSLEVLVRISDAAGGKLEVWDRAFAPTANATTIPANLLDGVATGVAGLDPNATTYSMLVRIVTFDPLTGQRNQTDYPATISGPGAGNGGGNPPPAFPCDYQSGRTTANNSQGEPIKPNSFSDFEAVIAACGTAQTINLPEVTGKTFKQINPATPELITFNAGTASSANPATGTITDANGGTASFSWFLEPATCSGCNYNYLVLNTDLNTTQWFRDTFALIALTGSPGTQLSQYTFVKYSEQWNYSDANRTTGNDGEIWRSTDQIQ